MLPVSPHLLPSDFLHRSHTTPPANSRNIQTAIAAPLSNESTRSRQNWRNKLVLCLVGLPARGKSYLAYRLVGFLRWRGLKSQLFNVGKHRRNMLHSTQDAKFFDADNVEAQRQRDSLAFEVLSSMLDWLAATGDVAVFDATNTTNKRRWEVVQAVNKRSAQLRVIFIESICDERRVLELNYLVKAQNSPDYKDMPIEEALADLRKRVANYEKVYEPIRDDHLSYLKLINLNSKVIANRIHGQLSHLLASFLMSIHLNPRPIFLTRAGACEGEESYLPLITSPNERSPISSITSTANLTERGKNYAKALEKFITDKCLEYWKKRKAEEAEEEKEKAAARSARPPGSPSKTCSEVEVELATKDHSTAAATTSGPSSVSQMAESGMGGDLGSGQIGPDMLPLVIYTSTLPRAVQTTESLAERALMVEAQSSLNMLDTGICKGMPMPDIRAKLPGEIDRWQSNKYEYRWPGGESQMDKARSLEPLVMEIERQTFPVLVVSHASTLQVLYGYFLGSSRPVDTYYKLWIPAHTVVELIPHQYGWIERRYDLRTEKEKEEKEKETAMRKLREAGIQGASFSSASDSHDECSSTRRPSGEIEGTEIVRILQETAAHSDHEEDEEEDRKEEQSNTQFYSEP